MSYLILVRHGESRWNLANKFTGWVDVSLTERGINEASAAAKKLKGYKINHAFTSSLERAHETLNIILSRQKMTAIFLHPIEKKKNWYSCKHHSERTEIMAHTTDLLNERYYGRLQGLNKDSVSRHYGQKKVMIWRRGYDTRPPGGESLKDVYQRVIPFFTKRVVPFLEKNKNVIVASHGNTLRALLKYIEKVPPEHLPHLNLPPGEPIIYQYSHGKYSRLGRPLTFDRPIL